MDEQSGETKEEEVIGEGIGELKIEELVPERGWWRDVLTTICLRVKLESACVL